VSCLALGAHAADPTPAAALSVQAPAGGDLVLKGDAQCTACHTKDDAGGKTVSIGATKHGTQADGRTPTCTSCHGSSQAHATYSGSGTQPAPDMVFDATSKATAAERSNTCLACHQTEVARMHWKGSPHDVNDVACTSCHQVHAAHDDVRDKRTQATVCFSCHKDQRALANKPSHHPVLEGKMACSDCHNTHGSLGEHLLIKDTTNETCFVCHADKRGPHLWNHQPVTEDCALCHNPHGTNADSLLVTRPPFL
jgi:DmsE family decaheme c-type cytochrome